MQTTNVQCSTHLRFNGIRPKFALNCIAERSRSSFCKHRRGPLYFGHQHLLTSTVRLPHTFVTVNTFNDHGHINQMAEAWIKIYEKKETVVARIEQSAATVINVSIPVWTSCCLVVSFYDADSVHSIVHSLERRQFSIVVSLSLSLDWQLLILKTGTRSLHIRTNWKKSQFVCVFFFLPWFRNFAHNSQCSINRYCEEDPKRNFAHRSLNWNIWRIYFERYENMTIGRCRSICENVRSLPGSFQLTIDGVCVLNSVLLDGPCSVLTSATSNTCIKIINNNLHKYSHYAYFTVANNLGQIDIAVYGRMKQKEEEKRKPFTASTSC